MNTRSRNVTQAFVQKKRDERDPSLYCDGDMVLGRPFFSRRFTVQKLLNISLSELKLCLSLQVGRLLYRLYLPLFHKGVESRTTNSKLVQDLSSAQQPVTHTKPLSWFYQFYKAYHVDKFLSRCYTFFTSLTTLSMCTCLTLYTKDTRNCNLNREL